MCALIVYHKVFNYKIRCAQQSKKMLVFYFKEQTINKADRVTSELESTFWNS